MFFDLKRHLSAALPVTRRLPLRPGSESVGTHGRALSLAAVTRAWGPARLRWRRGSRGRRDGATVRRHPGRDAGPGRVPVTQTVGHSGLLSESEARLLALWPGHGVGGASVCRGRTAVSRTR